jgi:phosphoribosylglycinamide formyltransferase-1
VPARLVVLVSGGGTNLQSLLDAAQSAYEIVGVVADRGEIAALDRAQARGVPCVVVAPGEFSDRPTWDAALAQTVSAFEPHWVVCAGFMRILGPAMLEAFPMRIVNTHPALLPAFPGAHGVRDALAYGAKVTGCTVHLVDAGVDTGPILAQRVVDVLEEDDEVTLHERIKVVERDLLVDIVIRLCTIGCTLDGRRASIP